MFVQNQILKQAVTPGNPDPTNTLYRFVKYTKHGNLVVQSIGIDGRNSKAARQTVPPTFLEVL